MGKLLRGAAGEEREKEREREAEREKERVREEERAGAKKTKKIYGDFFFYIQILHAIPAATVETQSHPLVLYVSTWCEPPSSLPLVSCC